MQFTVLFAAIVAQLAAAACTSPRVRREWGQLAEAEKAQYVAAVRALAARAQSFQYHSGAAMGAADFTATHVRNAHWAHVNAEFAVFHRAMLWRYEQALAANGWAGGLVYLDEAAWQTNWISRDLFSDKYFGGEGQAGQCLANGQFSQASGFTVLGEGGVRQCLQRCGNPADAFFSGGQVAAMLTGTTYRTINDGDSTNFHAGGHITLGGSCDVGNFYWSPRDPLFFLHHAYVDKVFWRWQNLCPQYRYSYEGNLAEGFNADNPEGGSSRVASLYIPLDSWSNLTPVDVLDTNNDELCYTYSKSAGDVDVTVPNCPDGSAPNYNPYGKGTFVQKPARPVPTATTSTAIPSPTADTKADTWLSDALVQLIFKGSSVGFGNAFPQPKAQKRRQDNQEETSISLSLVQTFFDYTSNTTTVTVDCTHIDSGRLDTYTIPEGYELHKAMCNRIVVTPIDYEHVCDLKKPKDWDAAKPMALFSNSLCNLEQELLEPVVYSSDPNAPVCPRFLNDAEIARFHVNPCVSKRNARLVSKTCRLLKQ